MSYRSQETKNICIKMIPRPQSWDRYYKTTQANVLSQSHLSTSYCSQSLLPSLLDLQTHNIPGNYLPQIFPILPEIWKKISVTCPNSPNQPGRIRIWKLCAFRNIIGPFTKGVNFHSQGACSAPETWISKLWTHLCRLTTSTFPFN